MSFFGKNIKKLRGIKSMSQQAFADLFSLKRGTLGAYEEGRSEPKIDTIIKIANYFSISIDDILTTELTVNQLLKFNDHLTLTTDDYDKDQFNQVSCITPQKNITYIEQYNNALFIDSLPKLSLPVDKDSDYRAYTVTNLEMTYNDNGLYPNDVVVGKKVNRNNMDQQLNGSIVLVLSKSQLILRRIYITGDDLTLKADHKNIDDLVIKNSDVIELWLISYIFYKRVPELNNSIEEKLAMLEVQMRAIKKSL